jgi:hypothetical protein
MVRGRRGAAVEGTHVSEREREIVIGTDENAPVGICFIPVTDPRTVKAGDH